MKTREEQIEQNFKNIKNGSLIFAWDFDPYDTPFIVVAKKENDKIYAKIKETNSGAIVLDGYRKQSDTVGEFVERLKQSLIDLYPEKNEKISLPDLEIDGIDIEMTINELAAEYGVEVEE